MQGHVSQADTRTARRLPGATRPITRSVPVHPQIGTRRPEYVWFRLEPGMDPLEGIAAVAAELDAEGGSIVQCMGSLAELRYIIAVPDAGGGWKFSDTLVQPGPMEFVAAQGSWGRDAETGELVVHLHGLVVDANGVPHGGHLVPGSKVLATCEIALLTGAEVAITRRMDPAVGRPILTVRR